MLPPNSPGEERISLQFFEREEFVAVSVGVVLLCVGLWTGYRLLTVIGVVCCIGAAVSATRRYRAERGRVEEEQHTQNNDNTVNKKKILLFDDGGFGGSIQVDDQHHEDAAYATLKNALLVPGATGPNGEPRKVAVRKPEADKGSAQQTYTAADFANLAELRQQEPHNEFNFLLNKTLRVIKEICFAHTVAFFWINRETRHLVVECKVTDSAAFVTERKLPVGTDVVSTVALTGAPTMLNQIAPGAEQDAIKYYSAVQGVNSFVGVPVFYTNDASAVAPIAVIAIDSKAPDEYGSETFRQLTYFTKLLSSLLQSYTEKYDLASDMKTMEADRNVRAVAAGHPGISAVVNAFMEEVSDLVPWDWMTAVLFDEGQRKWVIGSARSRANDKFVVAKQAIDFAGSVAGKAIVSIRVQTIADVSAAPRRYFHEHEDGMEFTKNGSFLALPLASADKCFGAVTFGSRMKQSYGKKEIASLQYLCTTLVMALDGEDLRTVVREHLMTDPQTGVGTRNYFLQRLNEEIERAKDSGDDLSVAMIALSPLNELRVRFGDEGADAAMRSVAGVLRSGVRAYDVVARYEDGSFGVLLNNTPANEAFLWAEKIRSKIAGNVIVTDDRNFSVTVTISICGVVDDLSARDCIEHAEKVMRQAQAAGGNMVRVF